MLVNQVIKQHPDLRNPISKASGVKLVKEDNLQDRVLTFAEQRRYLEKATPVLRDVATLILEQGCRPEEIYRLRGAEVHLDEGYMRIVRGNWLGRHRVLLLS